VAEASADAGCITVALTPTATGYVMNSGLNMVGAWFDYGDGLNAMGVPPGQCETTGGWMPSQCSSITFPPPPPSDGGVNSFPQATPGSMCLSGTAAQIPALGASYDYSNVFGIGIGLNFNDPPPGTQELPYPAPMNHVVGFQFMVSGLPTGTVLAEIDETATDMAPFDAYSYSITGNGLTTVMLAAGIGPGELSESFTPPSGTTEPPFDPSTVDAIHFHVLTSTSGPITVSNFCISDLSAIVCGL
jgi:hypothetical protein